MSLDITQLTGAPELVESIGGRDHGFSELPLESLGRLQAWIRAGTPDPWEDARRRCKGLPDAVAAEILDRARKEAIKWPPKVGTAAGMQALLGVEEGQIEVFFEALRIHHPGATRDEARDVYRALNRDPDGEERADRIIRVLFGRPRKGEVQPGPKGGAAATTGSTGA